MHSYKIFSGCLTATLLVVGFSCSDDDSSSGSGNTGAAGPGSTNSATTTSTGPGSGGGTGGMGPECPAPEPAQPTQETVISSVQAHLIDATGANAANVQGTICGINACSDTAMSDGQGNLTIMGIATALQAVRFNTGYNGRGYLKMTAEIPMAPTYNFGDVRAFRLPAFNQGVAITPGQDATNGGVTISVPAESVVEFDTLNLTDPADRKFVATVVDITGFPPDELPAVDPALNLEVIIGLGALDTHICPAAGLKFDIPPALQAAGWVANAEVEIYIHGTKTFEHYAVYGGWAKIADAVVDAGGMTVSTVQGQGIEILTTFGARLKP